MTQTAESRRPFVIGNWKMYKTGPEAAELAAAISAGVRDLRAEIGVAPAFPALDPVAREIRGIRLVAQDVFPEPEGAFTGAVSPGMLAAAGCSHVLAGHSERRQIFGDDDRAVRKKVNAVTEAEMIPILCVGETLAERDAGKAEEVVARQLEAGAGGLSARGLAALVIAYEPVWAIGTGRTASSATAEAMLAAVRSRFAGLAGREAAARVRILYGGSVNGDNAAEMLAGPNVDGVLVGGASLRADSFLSICRAAGRAHHG